MVRAPFLLAQNRLLPAYSVVIPAEAGIQRG